MTILALLLAIPLLLSQNLIVISLTISIVEDTPVQSPLDRIDDLIETTLDNIARWFSNFIFTPQYAYGMA